MIHGIVVMHKENKALIELRNREVSGRNSAAKERKDLKERDEVSISRPLSVSRPVLLQSREGFPGPRISHTVAVAPCRVRQVAGRVVMHLPVAGFALRVATA